MVKNEELLTKQNKELRDAVKRMQVAKSDMLRLKDEHTVLTN